MTACTASGGPLSETGVARRCAFQNFCDGFLSFGVTVSACAWLTQVSVGDSRATPAFRAERERIAGCGGAESCDEYALCVTRGHGPSYCAENPGRSCDGDVWVECRSADSYPTNVVDCGTVGMRCVVSDETPCTTGTRCPDAPSHCDGNDMVVCAINPLFDAEGWEVIVPCPLNMPCREDDDGRGACRAAECEVAGARCDGDIRVSCEPVGPTLPDLSPSLREYRTDCFAAFGGTCGPSELGEEGVRCVLPHSECDPMTWADSCDGDVLVSCVSGGEQRLDCRSLGFRTCVVDDTRAECVD